MLKKTVSAILLTLLLASMLTLALTIQTIRAEPGTIYINADGSISPPTAPISTADNITYVLTGNIVNDSIVIQRNNIVLDGAGYRVQGAGALNSIGIDLTGINSVTIQNTQIENFFDGIRVWFSSSSSINGNNITANTYDGIEVGQNSTNINVSGNNVAANNQDGIVLDSYSSSNSVIGNNVATNNGYGIFLYYSSNNSVSRNRITNNTYGFRADYSSSNSITGNNVTQNTYQGIYILESSNDNSISGNNIVNNQYGIFLSSSSSNQIYHNIFNNSLQTFSYQSVNVWDDGYPSGGNCWSDYNGTDFFSGTYQNVTGSDGIGDAPYVIDANNTDHYPLIRPFGVLAQSSTLVVCSPNPASVGSPVSCTATVSGQSPTGTVTWSASSSAGSFSQRVCTLSSGNCSTTYTDNSTGYVTITASYDGDSNNLPSRGSTTLTVFMSVTTGINVTVYPTKNLELTFANVVAAGSVTANETPTVSAPPLSNRVGQYYDVNVTASFVGNVTVSLAFDGSNMTQQQRSSLQMVQYTPIIGDINHEGTVDILDAIILGNSFLATPSSTSWNANADLNGDGVVNILDAIILGNHFGQTSTWVNITSYVDTTSNIVYGQTTHFSYIAIH